MNLSFIMLCNKDLDDLIARIADICEQLDNYRKEGKDIAALVQELEDLMEQYSILRKQQKSFSHIKIISAIDIFNQENTAN